MKRKCAKAALAYVPEEGLIGLGGGETIRFLAEEIRMAGKKIRVVTPSAATRQVCEELHIPVEETGDVSEIAVAFDGCDQLTRELDALKSGGGIHTEEKIVASMAEEYILLADEGKLREDFDGTVPIVLEIVRQAQAYLIKLLREGGCTVRIRTERLIEVFPPAGCSYAEYAEKMKLLPGVIDTSFFAHIAKRAIIVTNTGCEVIEVGKEQKEKRDMEWES